jgi:hypothetical protein
LPDFGKIVLTLGGLFQTAAVGLTKSVFADGGEMPVYSVNFYVTHMVLVD